MFLLIPVLPFFISLLMYSRRNHGYGGRGESVEEIDVVPAVEHRHGWRSEMARFVCGTDGEGLRLLHFYPAELDA